MATLTSYNPENSIIKDRDGIARKDLQAIESCLDLTDEDFANKEGNYQKYRDPDNIYRKFWNIIEQNFADFTGVPDQSKINLVKKLIIIGEEMGVSLQ